MSLPSNHLPYHGEWFCYNLLRDGDNFEQLFPTPEYLILRWFFFLFISDKSKMHTFLTRANALAAYTMSVLAALTFMCFLSTFLFETYSAPAKMNTVKVVVKHVPDYSASREKNDLGMDFFIPGRQKILKRSWNKELAEQKYLLS